VSPLAPALKKTKNVGCPAAKEVGMGNPAEKTTGHPTPIMLPTIYLLWQDFFWLLFH
jgi:hypothetical protein